MLSAMQINRDSTYHRITTEVSRRERPPLRSQGARAVGCADLLAIRPLLVPLDADAGEPTKPFPLGAFGIRPWRG